MTLANKSHLLIPHKSYLDSIEADEQGQLILSPLDASHGFQNLSAIELWAGRFMRANSSPSRCTLLIPFKSARPMHPEHSFENYKVMERWAYEVATGCGCPCATPTTLPSASCTLQIPFKMVADDLAANRITLNIARSREFDNLKVIERWANRYASGECGCLCCLDTDYQALITTFSPYDWWKCNDTGTPLVNYGSNVGNNAGVNGGGTGIEYLEPGPAGVVCSKAVNLNGRNFFYSGTGPTGTSHYACMMSVQTHSLLTDRPLFATWRANEGVMMYASTGGLWRQYHGATSYSMEIPVVDRWYHLLWGWNGTKVLSWVNGVPSVNVSVTANPGTTQPSSWYIGTYDNRIISIPDATLQHVCLFLDSAADTILTDANAAALAALAV